MSNLPEPIGRAQRREEADPSEQGKPIPRAVAIVTLLTVLSGAAYILLSEPFGPADLGDRRTLADLRPRVAQAGQVANGNQLFAANCVACHQTTGQGLAGVFPPLDGSEWVNGDERIVANILLHGIDGELVVKDKLYKGAMPAFGQLADAELAALASHIRATWSNQSLPLDAELFARERKAHPRAAPFKNGDELKALGASPP